MIARRGREGRVTQRERKRVMVVEDHDDTRHMLAELFTILGHETTTASDGEAALALYTRCRPELVLLDLGLPDMTGYEVAARFRKIRSVPPPMIVALSGYSQDQHVDRSFAADFDLHLVKPAGVDHLTAIVSDVGRVSGVRRWPDGSGVWSPTIVTSETEAQGTRLAPPIRMPDDKSKTGRDRNRINTNEEYEVRDWAKSLGVSREELLEAVGKVGNEAERVRDHLAGRRATSKGGNGSPDAK
jgi:CheY-like chemotaxis protein